MSVTVDMGNRLTDCGRFSQFISVDLLEYFCSYDDTGFRTCSNVSFYLSTLSSNLSKRYVVTSLAFLTYVPTKATR